MLFDELYDESLGEELLKGFEIPQELLLNLKTTNFCPNGCSYCCMNSNNEETSMDFEQVKEFIKSITEQGSYLTGITLSGGEPLFNNDLISFLEWYKTNKESLGGFNVSLMTQGVNPESVHAITYEERLNDCLKKNLITQFHTSINDAKSSVKRVKLLDKLMYEGGFFNDPLRAIPDLVYRGDKKRLSIKPINRSNPYNGFIVTLGEEGDEDFISVQLRGVYFPQEEPAVNSGRNEGLLKSTKATCGLSRRLSGDFDNFFSFFSLTIDSLGNLRPSDKHECWIGKVEPFANIKEHDYLEVIKRGLVYVKLLKEFFGNEEMLCYNCANGFNEFLKSKTKK